MLTNEATSSTCHEVHLSNFHVLLVECIYFPVLLVFCVYASFISQSECSYSVVGSVSLDMV